MQTSCLLDGLLTMMNTSTDNFTFKDQSYPTEHNQTEHGFGFVVGGFSNSDLLMFMDKKSSIVFCNRTDSRQYCLPQNAGISRKTGFLPVLLETARHTRRIYA